VRDVGAGIQQRYIDFGDLIGPHHLVVGTLDARRLRFESRVRIDRPAHVAQRRFAEFAAMHGRA
jgi:hypothetical protein